MERIFFVTTRGADGNWSELTNLGAQVNPDQHDRCPAFSPNFQTFFFDSERSGGFGDKDLWSLPFSDKRYPLDDDSITQLKSQYVLPLILIAGVKIENTPLHKKLAGFYAIIYVFQELIATSIE